MQADAQAIQTGINIMSNARSQIDQMCNSIEYAIKEAEQGNKNKKFRDCQAKVNQCVKKMRGSAQELVGVGKRLSALLAIVNQLGE